MGDRRRYREGERHRKKDRRERTGREILKTKYTVEWER